MQASLFRCTGIVHLLLWLMERVATTEQFIPSLVCPRNEMETRVRRVCETFGGSLLRECVPGQTTLGNGCCRGYKTPGRDEARPSRA